MKRVLYRHMSLENTREDSVKIFKTLPAERWKVLRLITRVEDFHVYMPNVRESKVIEKTPDGAITEWFVEVDGLPIRWKQKDTFDYPNFTINFKLIKGDIEVMEGKWILKKGAGDATEVTVEAQVRLGIPIFENVVKDVLKGKLRKNFENMLDAMEANLAGKRYRIEEGKVQGKVKGFVVMGHPYNYRHLVRIFKVFKPDVAQLTPGFLLKIFELAPAYLSSVLKGFKSATGETIDGYFVMCPIIPDMAILTPDIVIPKVLEGCHIGERVGAGILALGGFTSIIGEKYTDQLKSQIKIPVTTGNTYTAALAIEGIRRATQMMGKTMSSTKAVIIGGTGDIGSACARVLTQEVKEIVITGRSPSSLRSIHKELKRMKGAKVLASLNNNQAIEGADMIIAAASSSEALVDVDRIKPGAVVCDVAYPKNISYAARKREDIFIFSGGLASLPSPFNLGFDVGLPNPSILYGCFSEAIILGLEKRYENFSQGKGKIMPDKIEWIQKAAEKHGFNLAPFYWGEEMLDEAKVSAIQSKAKYA